MSDCHHKQAYDFAHLHEHFRAANEGDLIAPLFLPLSQSIDNYQGN